jgi:hypothetical protein
MVSKERSRLLDYLVQGLIPIKEEIELINHRARTSLYRKEGYYKYDSKTSICCTFISSTNASGDLAVGILSIYICLCATLM